MKLTPEQRKIRLQERRIGNRAAEMATTHMHQNANRNFRIHNRGGMFRGKPVEPMLESSKVVAKMGRYVLLGLNTTSNKYAFIHHFGFKGQRDSAFIRLTDKRFFREFTNRKRHFLDLRERSVFEGIYYKSRAVNYLLTELSKTRSAAFHEKFKAFTTKISE